MIPNAALKASAISGWTDGLRPSASYGLKLNLTKVYEQAKELYTERPDHAVIASTYAFALHLRGNTPEALSVLQKLKPEALEDPSVALYYGVMLSASGQPDQARKYLGLAQPTKLLPEEKHLLEVARKTL